MTDVVLDERANGLFHGINLYYDTKIRVFRNIITRYDDFIAREDHFCFMSEGTERLSKDQLAKQIGERIKFFRSKLNISQAELARRINKDPQHIELIENGKVSPNVYTLYIVATGLDVPLAELMKV